MTDPAIQIHVQIHLHAASCEADWLKAVQRVRWLRRALGRTDGADVAITVDEIERGLVPTGGA